jgi:hypothetical protein
MQFRLSTVVFVVPAIVATVSVVGTLLYRHPDAADELMHFLVLVLLIAGTPAVAILVGSFAAEFFRNVWKCPETGAAILACVIATIGGVGWLVVTMAAASVVSFLFYL